MTGFGALELLARAGFFVKGVVYMVVGALALQVAAHLGGRVTGTRGAFTTVQAQPFGRALLLVTAVGLLGYAAWRFLQAFLDPARLGHGWRGLALRVSFVAVGVVHAALGLQAFRVYRGLSAASDVSEREVGNATSMWRRCGAKPASGRSASAGSASRHAPSSLRCWDGASSAPAGSAMRLRSQPGGLGRWLLGVTAAGFVAYGFYQIIHARYVHIRPER